MSDPADDSKDADEPHAGAPAVEPGPLGPTHTPKRARRGDVIGARYVVEGQIGKGGMGRVLRVRHQVLGKSFALKLIRAAMATDKLICDMFYREARLASSLQHDNLCSIVDFGNDPEFGLFMVMELLEGISLHVKLREDGPMAPKAACAVMWDIAKAVKYMHDRSIVHGDIKSRNILLVRAAHKHRVVKLTDFGLARVDVKQLAHRVAGTPDYMAPELIRGQSASIASDIYALGILFYEILVGEKPFMGEAEDVYRQHLEDAVPRPSERLHGAIDERADEIIRRATAKQPGDRHQDMDELLFELRAFMNMLGISTYHSRNPMEPPRSPSKRGRSSSWRIQGAAEVFEYAPIPMAAVDSAGRVRVANSAFLEFLGVAGDAAGIVLGDSYLPAVYPGILTDLGKVASTRVPVTRVINLNDEDGHPIDVAVRLSAAPHHASVTGGDVHIALHPLARRQPRDEDPEST